MEWDDGLPEPSKESGDGWATQGMPKETRERRIKGHSLPNPYPHFHPLADCQHVADCIPATLIIHEPVNEMTLVEAVSNFLANRMDPFQGKDEREMREALAREKARAK
jgi:hypothetical protein